MAYKVIIADDEVIISERLKRFISRNIKEFDVVGCFRDGEFAIECLKNNDIDLVITDIIMLKVSGIDVAKYVFENNLKTKVVILSGYKEFEYAKKAIEYNVTDYLIKPTDFDLLLNVLNKIKLSLDAEKNTEVKNDRYDELMSALKEQLFINIVMGSVRRREDIDRKFEVMGGGHSPGNTKSAIFEVNITNYDEFLRDKWEYDKDKLNTFIANILNNGDKKGSLYEIFFRDKRIIMLYVSDEEMDFENYLKNKFDDAKKNLQEEFGLFLEISDPVIFPDVYKLSEGAGDAMKLLEKNSQTSGSDALLMESIKLFVSYLYSDCYEEAHNMYDAFVISVKEMPLAQIKQNVYDFFKLVYEIIEGAGIKIHYIKKGKLDYSVIFDADDYEGVRNCGKELTFEVIKYIKQYNIDSADVIINNAKKFIKENYHLDISLQDVANHVFLSQKYFSKFFKDKTGENFIDYLLKLRMEKAIE